MILFEITNGYEGDGYVRAYCWAENEEEARKLYAAVNPGFKIKRITVLLNSDTKPFCGHLTDDGSSPWL